MSARPGCFWQPSERVQIPVPDTGIYTRFTSAATGGISAGETDIAAAVTDRHVSAVGADRRITHVL